MNEPRKQSENKGLVLRLRVSEAEYSSILKNVEASGLKTSAYLRESALRHRVESTVDVRALALLGSLLSEFRRIGGLVKQLHASGDHQEAARIASGLDAIKRGVDQTREVIRRGR